MLEHRMQADHSHLLQVEPLPKPARLRQPMLDAAGDRAGAIAIYEEFARYLASELEVEPSDETRVLAETIRKRKSG